MTSQTTDIHYPHSSQSISYDARQVATAYNCPITSYDGTGSTIGIIELGGGYIQSDMTKADLSTANITVVNVDGGKSKSDGPNGADGEVMLDIEIASAVAPGAKVRVYFTPNTDQGFIDATKQAASECDFISISWGGAENSWSSSSIKSFSQVLAAARASGVTVFVASGDTGSRDSTGRDVTDYPASDPSVVGCGGTKLTLNSSGARASEVTWDENDTQSATGGGVSKVFAGRQVPDVAGNADPNTGYNVVVDGEFFVVGGTSAVAPLYAAMSAVIKQASANKRFDFINTVQTNPTICYDVTVGDNGGFKAGPGRDETTGFGVVDFGKLLSVLTSGNQVPTPPPTTTPTQPTNPTQPTQPTNDAATLLKSIGNQIDKFFA